MRLVEGWIVAMTATAVAGCEAARLRKATGEDRGVGSASN